MYRIGEFSKITFLTVKTLRYYDDISLLVPAQVNEDNGYRYYDDLAYQKAMVIKRLKKYGFTIKEMQEIVPSIDTDEDLIDYLSEKQEQLLIKAKTIKQVASDIETEVKRLKEVETMDYKQNIEVKTIKAMKVASIRYKGRYEEVGNYLAQLFKVVGMKGISAPMSIYHDNCYTEENADVEVAVEVKDDFNKGQVTTKTLNEVKCVTLMHVGPYENLSDTYKAIQDYIIDNKLEIAEAAREQYLKGPGMLFKGNPNKYKTLIMFPVK